MWETGRIIEDRYHLRACVGRGATAEVYRATRLKPPGGEVAVKLLTGGARWDSATRLRFAREAEIVAALQHPGAYPLYDFGHLADGTPFLVTQLIEGRSLARVLVEGPLPQIVVVRMLMQVSGVLAAAHDLGVVHRDLKPDNVQVELLLDDDCRVRLLDFGVAQWPDRGPLTREHALVGCPRYMAPEQALGEPAVPQSDLYALGIVAYEALTGRPPFVETSHLAHLVRQINDAPRPLREQAGGVDADLAALVSQLLEKRPEARPADARAVRARSCRIERRLDPGPAVRDTERIEPVVRRTPTIPMTPYPFAC